jgi:16S rRNA (guanine527-N7)-methyltransferase
MSEAAQAIADRLNGLLESGGLEALAPEMASRFGEYCALLMRWNARVNLTAIRDQEGILSRHFVEGIACARALPAGIGTLLDFGSGGGFPGIPIALCRPLIAVTLAESQGKKAAFLQEAVRVLSLAASVYSGRAETLTSKFDCVTLRAVDRMEQAVEAGAGLVGDQGWLALMTTGKDLDVLKASAGAGFSWPQPVQLPGGDERVLVLGERSVSSRA